MRALTKDVSNKASSSRSAKMSSDVSSASPSTRLHALHQTVGNQGMQRFLRARVIQPKLEVSQPGDALEREADRAAEQVVASSSPRVAVEVPEKRKNPTSVPSLVREVLGSPGRPLDTSTRAPMEEFFGSDLGEVRIHTGSQADASARALNALAYTLGNEIVFREGHHAPDTRAGRKLLAHELAHVVRDPAARVLHRQKDPAARAEAGVLEPGEVGVPEPSEVGGLDFKYPWQYPEIRNAIYQHRDQALSSFLRIYAEIDIASGAMQVKEATADEINAERAKLTAELEETNTALKADIQNPILRAKWERIKSDLDFLPALDKGQLPTSAAGKARVNARWTAYLHSKKHDGGKDLEHDALLGRVLDRFDKDPTFTRHPKWLRYMVIHFSGLRYAGAHRSYAPVTELVKRLKTEEVRHILGAASEKDIDQLVVEAETDLAEESKTAPRARAATIKQRLAELGGVETTIQKAFAKKGDESKLKAFEELLNVEETRKRISGLGDVDLEVELDARAAELTKTIGATRMADARRRIADAKKRRHQALVVHEIEQAQKALSSLDDAQALAMLKRMRKEGAFPDWFWKEIVRTTALRLEEVGTDWTKDMTDAERAALRKQGPVTQLWLGILAEWKKESTAWRAKHGKDLSLVVSRAVCNEIAEQCLHARGLKPSGGIGQKATWYAKGTEGRSFARPLEGNLEPGASLFWAKWQDQPPTDNVHKVRSNLFPVLRNEENETISDGMTDAKQRTYHVVADNLVTRTVAIGTSADPAVAPPTKTQWLTWYHEAIVVEVDKQRGRVITFETGPIGIRSDRRLRETTKFPQSGILDNPNIYVGVAPSGPEPKDLDLYLRDILPGR